ncbi:hypothetical protein JXA84_04125 [candidate division WOR-3 bacterium]|nr:hypothetical protein [candidate division WOR-3 bacterium]
MLSHIKAPPLNSTLMGVVSAVSDYYRNGHSTAVLYGGSGHAFLMNIHEDLCPSGPYCWNLEPFYKNLFNLGIDMVDEGFFTVESPYEERQEIESLLRNSLDRGRPCSLLNMEHQLILGYDEVGFVLYQPWGSDFDFTPDRLTFSSWNEFGDSVHVNFFTFNKAKPANEEKIIVESLSYAKDLYDNPSSHTDKPYAVGLSAYENWIKAIRNKTADEHGNWWNGKVWSECRSWACRYLEEISSKYPRISQIARELSENYKKISMELELVGDKTGKPSDKLAALQRAEEIEFLSVQRFREILERM